MGKPGNFPVFPIQLFDRLKFPNQSPEIPTPSHPDHPNIEFDGSPALSSLMEGR